MVVTIYDAVVPFDWRAQIKAHAKARSLTLWTCRLFLSAPMEHEGAGFCVRSRGRDLGTVMFARRHREDGRPARLCRLENQP